MVGTLEPTSFYLLILTVVLLAGASLGCFYVQIGRNHRLERRVRTWVGASLMTGMAAMLVVAASETKRNSNRRQLLAETSGCTERHPLPRPGC
jgi:hypothetical protein